MIANLKNIGTNPHAVEQPLDLNIPENKLMLALYLAAPEIENERRGLNTKMGVRRAKKEGHWAGKAPLGYKNKISEDGKKYITPQEPYATVIKRAFNELSQGIFSISEIYRRSRILGLNCSISNFYRTIRNPIYCGKIKVKAFKDEEEQEIRGLHEALISEKTFNKVQDMLKGNLKPKRSAIATPDDLQLRGFLQCPDCGRKITGSASKGRNTHVAYYHCNSPCKIRFNAKQLNTHFLEELRLFKLNKDDQHDLIENIAGAYVKSRKNIISERKKCTEQLNKLDDKIIRARELLLDRSIDITDFTAIKADYAEKTSALRMQLTLFEEQFEGKINIRELSQNVMEMLCNLPYIYKRVNIEAKRYLLETIFTGPLIYDGEIYRTTTMNAASAIIYLKNKELQEDKNRKKPLRKRPFSIEG